MLLKAPPVPFSGPPPLPLPLSTVHHPLSVHRCTVVCVLSLLFPALFPAQSLLPFPLTVEPLYPRCPHQWRK
jgi:hypothetical protein